MICSSLTSMANQVMHVEVVHVDNMTYYSSGKSKQWFTYPQNNL